jgi:hypothetical protein
MARGMTKFIWMLGGVCAAAACVLVLGVRRPRVDEMAHQLESAWADHHTVV